jgi:hypothetical protein
MVNSSSGGRSGGRDRGTDARRAPPPPPQPPLAPGANHVVHARFTSQDGRPVGNARYEVLRADGSVFAQGTTDWQGNARHEVTEPGNFTVRLVEFPAPPAEGEQ